MNKYKMFIKKIVQSQQFFAIMISLILTYLAFSVFFAQYLFSDVVTFAKNGDQLKESYPMFIKLGNMITNNTYNGADTDIFNGAAEQFYKLNMSKYIPFVLFAILGQYIPTRLAYILFFMCHMFAALYFGQMLGHKFFKLNKWLSLLMTISSCSILLYNTWFTAFAAISALTFPLLYFSLICTKGIKRKYWILLPLPYILAFTTGHIVYSCMQAAFMLIFGLLYGIFYNSNVKKAIVIKRVLYPGIMGGIICLPYLLQIFLYTKQESNAFGSTVIGNALYYKMESKDIISFFITSLVKASATEQLIVFNMGLIWGLVIFLFFKQKITSKMNRGERYIFWFGIIINIILLLLSFGKDTPYGILFYSLVPVFGSIHLPIRYAMITMPILFLSLSIGLQYIDNNNKKVYKLILYFLVISTILIGLYGNAHNIKGFDVNLLMIELVFTSVIIGIIINKGWNSKLTIVVWSMVLFTSGLQFFYTVNEVDSYRYIIEDRSIALNDAYVQKLDNFIDSTLDKKDKYKYVAYSSVEAVPNFLMGNYSWYNYQRNNLTNYLGYSLHAFITKSYISDLGFAWFDNINWRYLLDTRADFIVIDQVKIDENPELYNKIIDWDKSTTYLNSYLRLCKLKKFIPSYYTGVVNPLEYQLDHPEVLDNGYFYSHDLRLESLIDFKTNDSNYYYAKIDTVTDTTVAFLLFPSKYYHYYIDGVEIDPIYNSSQVFFQLNKGIHSIEIKYKNSFEDLVTCIFLIYYIICIFTVFIISVTKTIIFLKYKRK